MVGFAQIGHFTYTVIQCNCMRVVITNGVGQPNFLCSDTNLPVFCIAFVVSVGVPFRCCRARRRRRRRRQLSRRFFIFLLIFWFFLDSPGADYPRARLHNTVWIFLKVRLAEQSFFRSDFVMCPVQNRYRSGRTKYSSSGRKSGDLCWRLCPSSCPRRWPRLRPPMSSFPRRMSSLTWSTALSAT